MIPLVFFSLLVAAVVLTSAAPLDPVTIRNRARWTWIEADASQLGCVIGGDPPPALVVACGPMFAEHMPRFLLRDSFRGVDHPSLEPQRGQTVCVVEGVVRVVPGGHAVEGASVAIQGYPSLVDRGRPQTVQPGDRTRRVALAVLTDRRIALVGGSGTLDALVAELVDGGAVAAVYLDGGRAAHLVSAERDVFEYSPAERPASWVTIGRG